MLSNHVVAYANRSRTLAGLAAAGIVTLGMAAVPSHAAYTSTVLSTPGLVGYWQLGEATGDAIDSSSNTNDGTYGTAVTRGVAGPRPIDGFLGLSASNTAAGFTDNNALTSSITVTDADVLDPGTGDLSFSLFVNVDDAAAVLGVAISKMGTDVPSSDVRNGYYFAYRESSDQADLNIADPTAGSALREAGLTPETWHHIVGVIHPNRDVTTPDGYAASGVTLYLNGSLLGTLATDRIDGDDINTASDFVIGSLRDGSFGFAGEIDEVAIFNRALSSSEASALYQAAVVPEPGSLFLASAGLLAVLGTRRRATA